METQALELWELGQVSETDMRDAEFGWWDSVSGSGTDSGTGGTLENSTFVEMASDDWIWCAHPIGT